MVVGVEPGDHRVGRQRSAGHRLQRAVQPRLPCLAVDHHQLAIAAVERAQAEVAVPAELLDRHVAVEVPGQQRVDGRGLEQQVVPMLGAQVGVAQQVDAQGVEGACSLTRCARGARVPARTRP